MLFRSYVQSNTMPNIPRVFLEILASQSELFRFHAYVERQQISQDPTGFLWHTVRQTMKEILHLPRRLAVKMINLYQATLSPDHGRFKPLYPYGFCRHEPTCSEYGKRMIEERGLIIGGALLFRRLLSCNPFVPLRPEKIMKITGQTASHTHQKSLS